jgi:hypothetical protein
MGVDVRSNDVLGAYDSYKTPDGFCEVVEDDLLFINPIQFVSGEVCIILMFFVWRG